MSENRHHADLTILKRLQQHAHQLEMYTGRVPDLQALRHQLLQSSDQLGDELQRLRQLQDEWAWFFEHSSDLFAIASLEGHFERLNTAFERSLGYSREHLLATPYLDLIHPDDLDAARAEMAALATGRDTICLELRFRHHDGRWRWLEWTCPAPSAGSSRVYAIARDISERKLSPEERLYRAEHDELTGLGNRALFDQALAKAIARTERNPGNQVALLLLELDGLRAINDSHGHGVGDAVLKTVASRLAICHRQGDVSCRIGGDQFALLVEGSTATEVGRLAQRLLQFVEQPVEVGGLQLRLRCSVGGAVFPEHAHDAPSLLNQAALALQQARTAGLGEAQLGPTCD